MNAKEEASERIVWLERADFRAPSEFDGVDYFEDSVLSALGIPAEQRPGIDAVELRVSSYAAEVVSPS